MANQIDCVLRFDTWLFISGDLLHSVHCLISRCAVLPRRAPARSRPNPTRHLTRTTLTSDETPTPESALALVGDGTDVADSGSISARQRLQCVHEEKQLARDPSLPEKAGTGQKRCKKKRMMKRCSLSSVPLRVL